MTQSFFQALADGLTLGSLYALIAVGYTVVYGIVQLINFAHGEIFMVGAFGAVATFVVLGGGTLAWWVLPIMLAGGIVAAVLVALATERLAYRPLRNAPRLAPLITAIGISVFLQEAVRLFYGRIPGFPDAKSNVQFPNIQGVTGSPFVIGGVTIQRAAVFTVVALVICTIFLYGFVNRTRLGRAMQATSQDPDTARLMGIDIDKIIMIAFALGAALAAVAGMAQGLLNHNINFRMGFIAGLKAFSAAVLGGIGNIYGAVLGGLVLGVAESMAVTYVPGVFGGSAWKDVWAFIILILVLVFRPQGLLGARVVDRA
ncbi:branched-chain amino acid transport system permease protein [Friedmanniella endophytica]|uniref:Branched-chain amino acid transport system permease protein n=1 Tax=Microlunatus kandeliicorticis TaxID=1759536 RepID=A0A7W3P5V8_9ACTN|nr:branched-chain amino acid ABC transporter permease [Microlunatus kandeliicorticis]MBA8794295.1 branched-chain amino acid transport system permease protein [Microlunatus kandeliicorticis]